MAGTQLDWGTSLRQTWRLLPEAAPAIRPFLSAHGETPQQVVKKLPYAESRAGDAPTGTPDLKRYRDERQVFQTVGLAYENDGLLVVTELGQTVLRWLDLLHEGNAPVLARHVALALATCQLRNPTGAGRKYHPDMDVFPFKFIWHAMLSLGDRLSSAELLRGVLKTRDWDDLHHAIARIEEARASNDLSLLGDPITEGPAANDRAIAWIALAGFGWLLIRDKSAEPNGLYYTLRPSTRDIVARAAAQPLVHIEFSSVAEYVEYISASAALPPLLEVPLPIGSGAE
jgi:hypothetical protein